MVFVLVKEEVEEEEEVMSHKVEGAVISQEDHA